MGTNIALQRKPQEILLLEPSFYCTTSQSSQSDSYRVQRTLIFVQRVLKDTGIGMELPLGYFVSDLPHLQNLSKQVLVSDVTKVCIRLVCSSSSES